MTIKLFAGAAALALLMSVGTLVRADDDTPASAEEIAAIQEALKPLGCTFDEVDKESDNRFEIDDAKCDMGQYDFKLDGEYRIILMDVDG